jgi:hypothetical protein
MQDLTQQHIYQMQCSFSENLFDTCMWANSAFDEEVSGL